MTGETLVAIDLGAGSGRVVRGTFGGDRLELEVVHRFPNRTMRAAGHERWDTRYLFAEIKRGLRELAGHDVTSIGVDTWGVDYGLFDDGWKLLEEPVSYRDGRTRGALDRLSALVAPAELFRRTGVQLQPFNTIFQLHAQLAAGEWPPAATRMLMMPDIFNFRLCGATTGELTNATTTQLVDCRSGRWDAGLAAAIGIDTDLLPPLVRPGTRLGTLRPALQEELGLGAVPVIAPATHDTGSAVAGTPLADRDAFLSSGTWSLLGIETEAPVLTEAARRRNLTNEGGVSGRNRLLANIMGLWILEACRQQWRDRDAALDYAGLDQALGETAPFQGFIQPDDPRFFQPSDMIGELTSYLRETGQPAPQAQAALCRIVLESLALRYAAVLRGLESVTGRSIDRLHIVGGGSQNTFLNQATANATGREVLAGPVEATARGNLAVQAIAAGRFASLDEARHYLARVGGTHRFMPADGAAWRAAERRYGELTGDLPDG